MKKHSFYFLMLLCSFTLCMVSCEKDDNDGVEPTLLSSDLSADNLTVSLTFSEGLYAKSDGSGVLTESAFTVSVNGGVSNVSDFVVNHTAGSELVIINLELLGAADGDEVLTITPVASAIFDIDGNKLDVLQVAELQLADLGVIGSWKAYDISLVLVGLGYDDSLYAYFNADQTYTVLSYIAGIEYELIGTFIQEKSTNANIWDITLNQVSLNGAAYPVTSQGIFEVYSAVPDSMFYEVAQSNPAIAGVTPPTSENGFGSTSGGAFGIMNIQKYMRIEE